MVTGIVKETAHFQKELKPKSQGAMEVFKLLSVSHELWRMYEDHICPNVVAALVMLFASKKRHDVALLIHMAKVPVHGIRGNVRYVIIAGKNSVILKSEFARDNFSTAHPRFTFDDQYGGTNAIQKAVLSHWWTKYPTRDCVPLLTERILPSKKLFTDDPLAAAQALICCCRHDLPEIDLYEIVLHYMPHDKVRVEPPDLLRKHIADLFPGDFYNKDYKSLLLLRLCRHYPDLISEMLREDTTTFENHPSSLFMYERHSRMTQLISLAQDHTIPMIRFFFHRFNIRVKPDDVVAAFFNNSHYNTQSTALLGLVCKEMNPPREVLEEKLQLAFSRLPLPTPDCPPHIKRRVEFILEELKLLPGASILPKLGQSKNVELAKQLIEKLKVLERIPEAELPAAATSMWEAFFTTEFTCPKEVFEVIFGNGRVVPKGGEFDVNQVLPAVSNWLGDPNERWRIQYLKKQTNCTVDWDSEYKATYPVKGCWTPKFRLKTNIRSCEDLDALVDLTGGQLDWNAEVEVSVSRSSRPANKLVIDHLLDQDLEKDAALMDRLRGLGVDVNAAIARKAAEKEAKAKAKEEKEAAAKAAASKKGHSSASSKKGRR